MKKLKFKVTKYRKQRQPDTIKFPYLVEGRTVYSPTIWYKLRYDAVCDQYTQYGKLRVVTFPAGRYSDIVEICLN